MLESSARSQLVAGPLASATLEATEEVAVPSDASQNVLVATAEEKLSEAQPRTDGCMVQNEGMSATHQNREDYTSTLESERSVGVASKGDHSEPLAVERVALTAPDGMEHVNTEHRNHDTGNTSAEEGEAATTVIDNTANSVDESKGDTNASDDAESDDGFGGFEEADARSTAGNNRGDADDDGVEPEAFSFSESSISPLIPAVSAASSSADIFTTGREDFLAQVRKLLCPSAFAATEQEGSEKLPFINLDILIHQLAIPQTFNASDIAVHASVMVSEQAQYQAVTPIKWDGSNAEMRFLSRFARSRVESSARLQPSVGHHHAQAISSSKVNIFQASGAVVHGDYLAGSSGAETSPVENGDHAGIVGAGPTQPSGNAELQSQPALDTSGFGAWATDPTLIPGVFPSSNAGANSAALAHLERRASPQRGSERHAGTSPSRLRSSSVPRAEQTAGKQMESVLPDLSFMLSDTLVIPQ